MFSISESVSLSANCNLFFQNLKTPQKKLQLYLTLTFIDEYLKLNLKKNKKEIQPKHAQDDRTKEILHNKLCLDVWMSDCLELRVKLKITRDLNNSVKKNLQKKREKKTPKTLILQLTQYAHPSRASQAMKTSHKNYIFEVIRLRRFVDCHDARLPIWLGHLTFQAVTSL